MNEYDKEQIAKNHFARRGGTGFGAAIELQLAVIASGQDVRFNQLMSVAGAAAALKGGGQSRPISLAEEKYFKLTAEGYRGC